MVQVLPHPQRDLEYYFEHLGKECSHIKRSPVSFLYPCAPAMTKPHLCTSPKPIEDLCPCSRSAAFLLFSRLSYLAQTMTCAAIRHLVHSNLCIGSAFESRVPQAISWWGLLQMAFPFYRSIFFRESQIHAQHIVCGPFFFAPPPQTLITWGYQARAQDIRPPKLGWYNCLGFLKKTFGHSLQQTQVYQLSVNCSRRASGQNF